MKNVFNAKLCGIHVIEIFSLCTTKSAISFGGGSYRSAKSKLVRSPILNYFSLKMLEMGNSNRTYSVHFKLSRHYSKLITLICIF
jgi:hypothetical protein